MNLNQELLVSECKSLTTKLCPESTEDVATFYYKTDVFNDHFPQTIPEWNKLDIQIRSESFLSFRNSKLKIGPPIAKPFCNFYNSIALKLLKRLRRGLRHLSKYKFRHDF